ncbi:MAG: hypothetical protein K8Q97_00155 [Candidatus Andersenbacteria bacterium]|nr:hypothetical protein [Candidatus Andersenbacteria bacterium]
MSIHGGIPGIMRSLIDLIAFGAIPSLGLTMLYQQWRGRTFSSIEFLTISFANFLLAIPLLLLVSISVLPYQFFAIPITILSIISCIPLGSLKKDTLPLSSKDLLLLGVIILFIGFIWILTHAYYPLPDFDPYYWLGKYQGFMNTYRAGNLVIGNRPGFFSIYSFFILLAHIDSYALFKYALPQMFAMSVFPLWMIAKTVSGRLYKVAIVLSPLWAASTILYATTSMPQMIFILSSIFAISFLAYSRITKDTFFLWAALCMFGGSILMYELSIFPLIIAIGCLLFFKRHSIGLYAKKNSIITTLLALLILSNLHFAQHQITFFLYWIFRIINQILAAQPNLRFPAYYINVDKNAVGWSGALGVTQYYAYYVGSAVIVTLGLIVYFSIKKNRRDKLIAEIKNHVETQIALGIFLAFFCISEILPRAIGLALLPERAWIFGGIACTYFAILALAYSKQRIANLLAVALIASAVVSGTAALYVNNQKKYLIPRYQLTSASWVQTNLPSNRLMISDENSDLLQFFSSSNTAIISPLYCNQDFQDPQALLKAIKKTTLPWSLNDEIYIFFAITDPSNPYKARPYIKPREVCSQFVFDQHPEKYARVYSDSNKIIIWKVK